MMFLKISVQWLTLRSVRKSSIISIKSQASILHWMINCTSGVGFLASAL
jgi:hypothetical protein